MRKSRTHSVHSYSKARMLPLKLIGGVIIILLVFCLALGYIWRVLTTSEYFRIEDVINKESEKVDLSYLKGRNIFSIDLAMEAGAILGSFPDYNEVKLIRLLPHKLFVYFVKRQPVALVKLYKYFALDKEGVLFQTPYSPQELEIPVITGLETKIFGVKPGVTYNNKEILFALTVIKESKRNRILKDYKINKIDLANPLSASVFIPIERSAAVNPWGAKIRATDNLEVKLGPDNIKTKLILLGNLLAHSKSELSNAKYIDLRFKEPVIKLKDAK